MAQTPFRHQQSHENAAPDPGDDVAFRHGIIASGVRTPYPPLMSDYPPYTRAERIADAVMHVSGLCLAVTGAVVLVLASTGEGIAVRSAAAVYAAALIATFLASAAYHMTPWERLRPALRRVDHAAIYLKIAGTYTPLVVLLGSWFAYVILVLVWALAVAGALMKLAFWQVPGRYGPALYLVMGWLALTLIWPLAQTLPTPALWLIVAGGLLYSAGVPFYATTRMKYSNAVWHGFVLAASACFFVAILLATGLGTQTT